MSRMLGFGDAILNLIASIMAPLQSSMETMALVSRVARARAILPLDRIKRWSEHSSFKIDALGLVTFLGADEVDLAVGSLQRRQYTEWLPLLAAFVITSKRFTAEQPGFVMYNLDDGIVTTELKGWFTRWLTGQRINGGTSRFTWTERSSTVDNANLSAPILATLLVAPMLSCSILIGDWYGLANSIAIALSILVRVYLVSQYREGRNSIACPVEKSQLSVTWKTICVVRSDGKMLTIRAPYDVLQSFIRYPVVKSKRTCQLVQQIGWVALGVHVCVLGTCTLFTQIYTVLLLVLSTWAFTRSFGNDLQYKPPTAHVDDDYLETEVEIPFNDSWSVIRTNPKRKQEVPGPDDLNLDKRQRAWAYLNLNDSQERFIKRSNFAPSEENEGWWREYHALKLEYRDTEKSGAALTDPRISTLTPGSTSPKVSSVHETSTA